MITENALLLIPYLNKVDERVFANFKQFFSKPHFILKWWKHNKFSKQDSLPTHIHNMGRPIRDNS